MCLSLDEAVEAIVASGRRLDARGLAPATSGNYSVRLRDGEIAVTVSGRHKGRLTRDDVMRVDEAGIALENKRPSAETGLHTLVYKLYPQVNAILHVHSVPVVTLTRHLPNASEIVLKDYEMLKAFPGITTHQTVVRIPIFENSQNIAALAREVSSRFQMGSPQNGAPLAGCNALAGCNPPAGCNPAPAYLIRGHGAYGWGKDLEEAERVIEALEHLLSCEIEALRLRAGASS